jgi:hypothetical protein
MKNNRNDINIKELHTTMLILKVGTLMYYMPENEVKSFYECSYEFDVDEKTGIPFKLHTWKGENHNYQKKSHRAFDIPEYLRVPLLINR